MNQKEMTTDEIASKAAEILRVCNIVEAVVKQDNNGISNPAKAGMIAKILMGDCS